MAKSSSSFQKGDGRKRGPAKGTVHARTKAAKDALQIAFDELGGPDRLVEWVKEDPANERIFYGQIWPKLLPLQVSGEGGGPLVIQWQQ